MKLTETEKLVLKLLLQCRGEYTSPTELSNQLWGNKKHSGTTSRVCKKLEEFNLVERSDKGHYRSKQFITRNKIRYHETNAKCTLIIPKNTAVNLVVDVTNEVTFRINSMDWAPEPRFGTNGILINHDHIKCIARVY
jgi:hypothetical protein